MRKFWNILQESGIFMHLEEKAAQIADLFARLGGGVLEHPQHPLVMGLYSILNRPSSLSVI